MNAVRREKYMVYGETESGACVLQAVVGGTRGHGSKQERFVVVVPPHPPVTEMLRWPLRALVTLRHLFFIVTWQLTSESSLKRNC